MQTESSGKSVGIPAACIAFQPITWSAKDTDATIAGVKEHNSVWMALCGAKAQEKD